MLYEMTTGEVPYTADTPMAVMVKHIVEPLPVPSQRNPNLLEGLEHIVLKSLAKNAAGRYQSTGELAAALASVADKHPNWSTAAQPSPASVAKTKVDPADTTAVPEDDDLLSTIVPPPETIQAVASPPTAKPARRSRLAVVFISGVIVVVLGVIGFFAYPNLTGGSRSSTADAAPQLLEPNANMKAALQFLENGQIEEALVAFEGVLSNTPDQWDIYIYQRFMIITKTDRM